MFLLLSSSNFLHDLSFFFTLGIFNEVLVECSGSMVWLSEDSDEGCIVAEVECVVAGKMFHCLYLTKLGIADDSLTGSVDCCVDSCIHREGFDC